MSDKLWTVNSERGLPIFGIFVVFLAVVYTRTGKAWIKYNGWVYRADEPKRYWLEVILYYLLGFGCIGLWLYHFVARSK